MLQIINALFSRLVARQRHPDLSTDRVDVPPAAPAPRKPARTLPGPQFRPQICCHTGQVASVQVFAPDHLAGDADALLRIGLRQLQQWDNAGLHVPYLAIQLPADVARSEAMALP